MNDLDDRRELRALRERAEAVLERRGGQPRDRDQPRVRPVLVEFSGSPKSGKSTCIDIVGHFFRRQGFQILAPTEGASKRTPYYLKENLVAFNTWSASYALNHIFDGLYSADRYDISILDRGLFDALVWFELLSTKGDITEDVAGKIHDFLLIEDWRSVIDAVFLFQADPATSMDRENKDKLVEDTGRAMNPDFLADLNEAYDSVRKRYESRFPRFEVIDTGVENTDTPQLTAINVANVILDLFDRKET